jgi:hypothetical protein
MEGMDGKRRKFSSVVELSFGYDESIYLILDIDILIFLQNGFLLWMQLINIIIMICDLSNLTCKLLRSVRSWGFTV